MLWWPSTLYSLSRDQKKEIVEDESCSCDGARAMLPADGRARSGRKRQRALGIERERRGE